MSGSTDRLPRLLALVPWLLAHPNTPLTDVAARFDVTQQQIRADLDLIWMCGLPGYGPGDLMDVIVEGDRVTLQNADTIDRPLRLTSEEALALIAALRVLLGLPGIAEVSAVESALAKLEAAAGSAGLDAAEVAAVADDPADPDVAAAVARAAAQGKRLHLRYWVPARDETTEREVDPIRILTAEGATYLVGWCRRVGDVRTFRLDRVLQATVLDDPAEVPAAARERALDTATYTPAPEDRLVTFDLEPAGRWVADYHPCEEVVERGDGGLRVRLRAREDAWVRRLALGLAGSGRVVDPPDVVEDVRRAAAAALAAYPAH